MTHSTADKCRQINKRRNAEIGKSNALSTLASGVAICAVFVFGLVAMSQADNHYKRMDLINQEMQTKGK